MAKKPDAVITEENLASLDGPVDDHNRHLPGADEVVQRFLAWSGVADRLRAAAQETSEAAARHQGDSPEGKAAGQAARQADADYKAAAELAGSLRAEAVAAIPTELGRSQARLARR